MYLKRFYIGPYELAMLAIVALAVVLRFILIRYDWPVTNSDEATIDLMALHIAYRGEQPIFFYGQSYMGPLEAYVGAIFFRIFGVSLFTVRLGLLPLFALFLICMYALIKLIYTKKFAVLIVGLLALGSANTILNQLKAIGGYPEIVFLAAFIFLLVTQLALTALQKRTAIEQRRRILVYGLLGLTIGFSLWTDELIIPVVFVCGLLLVYFCYQDLWRWSGLALLSGILLGIAPLIYYNLTVPFEQSTWNVLVKLHHAGFDEMRVEHIPAIRQLIGVFFIGLPAATGANPLCESKNFPLFGPFTPRMLQCTLLHGTWAFCYFMLWLVACLLIMMFLWQRLRQRFYQLQQKQKTKTSIEETSFVERQELVRQCVRLALLVSAALAFVLYATSPSAALTPLDSARYLICMSLATPVLLWPLWNGVSNAGTALRIEDITGRHLPPVSRPHHISLFVRVSILLFIGTILLIGTIRTFADIPRAQAVSQQREMLMNDLLRIHATRFYSDYWTCGNLIFRSQERIICSDLDTDLSPFLDRYTPYHNIVRAAPLHIYVFASDSPQATTLAHKVQIHHIPYHLYTFDGYVIYESNTRISDPGP